MTARQLYERLVGEGGMSPEYFHKSLTFFEARDYLKGIERRYHAGWRQARLLAGVVYKVLTGKELELELPFDREDDPEEAMTDEDVEYLRKMAEERAKEINN